ncbi:hypothetical protein PMAYCL1PPCAC_28046, partial [Pristionchus mayeri]
ARFSKSEGGLRIIMQLYPSAIPFYDLRKLDWGRFKRFMFFYTPALIVSLNDSEDPVVEKVTVLLSTTIHSAIIEGSASSEDFSMCAQLLRTSTLACVSVETFELDDVTASTIISIASRADSIRFHLIHQQKLFDAAAFIAQLDTLAASFVVLNDTSIGTGFVGLPPSFWTIFLNEKLRSKSVKYVQVQRKGERKITDKITKAPIQLPGQFSELFWENAKGK